MDGYTWAFWVSMLLISCFFALVIVFGMVKAAQRHHEFKHRNELKKPRPVKLEKNVLLPYSRLKWMQKERV